MHRCYFQPKLFLSMIVLFLLCVCVYSEVEEGEFRSSVEKILSILKSEGKSGVLKYARNNKRISKEFIVKVAEYGAGKRYEAWVTLSKILADESKDLKTIGDVLLRRGRYYRLTNKIDVASHSFHKAFEIFQRINDEIGEGEIYLEKCKLQTCNHNFETALNYIDSAFIKFIQNSYTRGLGDVFLRKGEILRKLGNIFLAEEMYKTAIEYYETCDYSLGLGNTFLRLANLNELRGKKLDTLGLYKKSELYYKIANRPLGLAHVYRYMGVLLYSNGDNSQAIEKIEKAISLYRDNGDISLLEDLYQYSAILHYRTGDFKKSIQMYEEAIYFCKKKKCFSKAGFILQQQSDIAGKTGNDKMALEIIDKSLEIFNRLGDQTGMAEAYLRKGNLLYKRYETLEAIKMYNRAFSYYLNENNLAGQGKVFLRKGRIYTYIGEYENALRMYDIAFSLIISHGKIEDIGNILFEKAILLEKTGELRGALRLYDRVLKIYKKYGSLQGEGNVWIQKGKIYFLLSQYGDALLMNNNGIRAYKKCNYTQGIADACFGIGLIYLDLRLFEKSKEQLKTAQSLYNNEKNVSGILGIANVIRAQALIHNSQGNSDKAIRMYDNAYKHYAMIGEKLGMFNSLLKKGDIYSDQRRFENAAGMFVEAKKIAEILENPLILSSVLLREGILSLRTGRIKTALKNFNSACTYISDDKNDEKTAFIEYNKGEAFDLLKDIDNAKKSFQLSTEIWERVRLYSPAPFIKLNFLKSVSSQYERIAKFMLENCFNQQGYYQVELLKGRVFLDHLSERIQKDGRVALRYIHLQRDKLIRKQSALNKELYQTSDKKKIEILKKVKLKNEMKLDALHSNIRMGNSLESSFLSPKPVSIKNLWKNVIREGENIVEYFFSGESVFVFLINRNEFFCKKLDTSASEINTAIEKFLAILDFPDPSERSHLLRLERFKAMQTLYYHLFAPIEGKLSGDKIFIVPDGSLVKIPFEALAQDRDKKTRRPLFLINKYKFKYVQSATVLSVLRKHYHKGGETKRFIGFGDPVYDYKKFKQGKPEKRTHIRSTVDEEIKGALHSRYARDGGIMSRLQDSGKEVQTIAGLFLENNHPAVSHLRENATEDRAKAVDMKNYDYIHFACHGLLNEDFQSLVLAQNIEGTKEDGFFTLNEIMNCDYNAKLIVLSACQTGSGKLEKGEGVTGLTRAFMYAGTPAVVASLWEADDSATKELMVAFYRNLLEKNMDKAEALRQAKLEMIKNGKYVSPVYWSAFVMYGE